MSTSSSSKIPDSKDSAQSLFVKCLSRNASWDEESLSKAIYWFKHILSVPVALIFGYAGITGGAGILGYLFIVNLSAIFYAQNYLNVDEDEFGGKQKFLGEGFMPSFALFLLIWIYLYTTLDAGLA